MKRKNEKPVLCEGKLKDGSKCPLIESCVRYLEEIDMSNTPHFAYAPYNKERSKCTFQIKFTEDDIMDRVNQIINTINN